MMSKGDYNLLGEIIHDRIARLIHDTLKELPPAYAVHARRDFRLYLPKVALEILEDYIIGKYNPPSGYSLIDCAGFKIFEGYENFIVLAHNRAVERPSEKLIFKETIF